MVRHKAWPELIHVSITIPMKLLNIIAPALAMVSLGACTASKGETAAVEENRYAAMARETLDSLYVCYSVAGENLLRENYPHDASYKATYLAGEDKNLNNPYSYLWPYSGTFPAVRALYEATGDSAYLSLLEQRILPGLEEYLDAKRVPTAYASYINSAPESDRFYDDNVWLGIDFTDMYLLCGRESYLDKARMIWKFIESGTDSVLGGGIYWCEQKKESKNTCSNAPGSVYALKLFKATGDSLYLQAGRSLYEWTKANLQDTTDCLYFDNINLNHRIGRAKFAYNSGQMLQAASLLYCLTGEKPYLDDAEAIAESAHRHFFSGTATDEKGEFPLLCKGNVWFTAVMVRGFNELYGINGNPRYMDDLLRNLDYAWNHARDKECGLFQQDWSGSDIDEKKWLLTQAAMVEMQATAASYFSDRKNDGKV